MFGIGPMELVLILVVALLVLGPKRMPELARTLGRGLGEFRRASSELRQSLALDDLQNELRDGLAGAGTIRRPKDVGAEGDDRPAQAGDDLPVTPEAGAETGAASADTDANTDDDASADSATGDASAGQTPRRHPGELPPGGDTDHHDSDSDDDRDVNEEASEPPRRPAPADPGLGSVPVGAAGPETAADDAAQPAAPGETAKDAGAAERGTGKRTDDGRG